MLYCRHARQAWTLLNHRYSRTLSSHGCLPADFGARDGTPIANKNTVLSEVDRALGKDRSPDLEVILTDHVSYLPNRWLHSRLLRWGHVAVRYTTSDGTQRVMNILGGDAMHLEGARMVNFVPPADYIYGTRDFDTACQQGGAYNRDFVGVRVERCAAGAIDTMHAYFEALDLRSRVVQQAAPGARTSSSSSFSAAGSDRGSPSNGGSAKVQSPLERGAAQFRLLEARLTRLKQHIPSSVSLPLLAARNYLRRLILPSKRTEASVDAFMSASVIAGNCAQWTSGGLNFAGLLRRPRLFPKSILVEILEGEKYWAARLENVHVVVYKHVRHAVPRDPEYAFLRAPEADTTVDRSDAGQASTSDEESHSGGIRERRPSPPSVSGASSTEEERMRGYDYYYPGAYTHPLAPASNYAYADMHAFADVIVEVPPGAATAVVTRIPRERVRDPPRWLFPFRAASVAAPTAVLFGAVEHIGPMGPIAAATWLVLNWWLY